jgi:hypothetical protein
MAQSSIIDDAQHGSIGAAAQALKRCTPQRAATFSNHGWRIKKWAMFRFPCAAMCLTGSEVASELGQSRRIPIIIDE